MLHNPDKKVDAVAEGQNQIEEIETQVSSQPMIEEVKQVPGERELAISPQRNIITTGNSLSRLSKLIYQNSLIFVDEPTTGSPTLLAWCSKGTNTIDIVDFNTKESYASLNGAKISDLGKT
mgnify:CR=1 FL=1